MARQPLLPALSTTAIAVGLVLIAAAPSAAHNYIVSSTPAEGETLTAPPSGWQITTNEDLLDLGGQGSGFAILVSDEAGQFYGDSCVTVQGPTLSMPAALGADGDYTLVYQLISADGHTLSGEISFTWQAPANFEPHQGMTEVPVCGETESSPAVVPAADTPIESGSDSAVEVEPIIAEPIADEFWPIIAIAAFLVVLAIIGVVTATILRARSRASAPQPDGLPGTDS